MRTVSIDITTNFYSAYPVGTYSGLFHTFSMEDGNPVAIVEMPCGTILMVPADHIKFTPEVKNLCSTCKYTIAKCKAMVADVDYGKEASIVKCKYWTSNLCETCTSLVCKKDSYKAECKHYSATKVLSTGVARRLDDLGRIVIPLQIRRELHIAEGDALEIFIKDGTDLVLRRAAADEN